MIEIKRKRISCTQGSYEVYFKGKKVREFGDTIELKSNQKSGDGAVSMAGWIGKTDTEIMVMLGFDCMTFEMYDETWHKQQEERRVLEDYRRQQEAA